MADTPKEIIMMRDGKVLADEKNHKGGSASVVLSRVPGG